MKKHFLRGIDTVIIRVHDIARSKEWYLRKMEFNTIHEDSELRLVVLDTFSPTSLTLWETDSEIRPDPRTASYPIFSTDNATLVHELLKSRGVETGELIIAPPVIYFTFRDPDENILEVCQVHE